LNSVSPIVDNFAPEATMAQEFRPGEIVPQSGIYTMSQLFLALKRLESAISPLGSPYLEWA